MKLISLVFIGIFLFSLTFVLSAEEGHDAIFEQAKELIDSKVACDDLSEDQLEMIGEYYMELMHPGELHEIMDARLGGEGSESLRLAHVNIGKMQYCGEYTGGVGYGWMMGGGYGMGQGMMYDLRGVDSSDSNWMGSGMYGSRIDGNYWFYWAVKLLIVVVLILLIVLLSKKVRDKGK